MAASTQINAIDQKLRRLGCSAEVFCSIASIPTSRWSRVLHGQIIFPGDEIVRLFKIVRTLEDICNAAAPIPVDFKSIEQVKKLFEHRTEAGIAWIPIPTMEVKIETGDE